MNNIYGMKKLSMTRGTKKLVISYKYLSSYIDYYTCLLREKKKIKLFPLAKFQLLIVAITFLPNWKKKKEILNYLVYL